MKKTLLFFIAVIVLSCNSKTNQHNGIYENSFGGLYIVKDDTLIMAKMFPEMKNSVKIGCKQYSDRIECKKSDGTTGILKVEQKGISDGIMYFTKINNDK